MGCMGSYLQCTLGNEGGMAPNAYLFVSAEPGYHHRLASHCLALQEVACVVGSDDAELTLRLLQRLLQYPRAAVCAAMVFRPFRA